MSLCMLGAVPYVGADLAVAKDPKKYLGQVVSSPEGQHTGQCVSYVRTASGATHSSSWAPGEPVRGNTSLKPGTAIATFQDGKYHNRIDGRSHGAIYMSQDEGGLYVIDQWKGQPVHARYVRFKGGKPNTEPSSGVLPVNDGDAYSVVLVGGLEDRLGGLEDKYGCGGLEDRLGGLEDRLGFCCIGEVFPSDDPGMSQAELLKKMEKYENKSILLKKTGPLENWQWGLIGLGGLTLYFRKKILASLRSLLG